MANLVGIPAAEKPTRLRVAPGNPDSSYLMCKLDRACGAISGDHMPLGGVLSADEIAAVRAWIASLAVADAGPVDKVAPSFSGLDSVLADGETSVTLSWRAATDDVTAPAQIVYRVYLAPSSNAEEFSVPALSVTGVTAAKIAGLTAKHTYYFVVRAEDAAHNADGNTIERSATTLDLTAPSFAGLASAGAIGPTSVALTWAAGTDKADAASTLRYRVYAGTSPGAETFATPALTTVAGATSATVTGLAQGTLYYFVARAVDTSNNEDANNVERSAATTDIAAPTFAGASGASGGTNAVTLTWTAATDNITASNQIAYLVYQASTSRGQSFSVPTYTTAPGITSFPIGGLAASTKYYFVVRARDAAGNIEANAVEVSATTLAGSDTTPPTFAGASSATAGSDTSIALSWSAASDNVTASSSLVYLVYRAPSSGAESYAAPTYTTTAGAATFIATGLAPSTTYYFVVRARDQAGNTDPNIHEVSARTPADTTAPTFAGASSATLQSSTSIALAWPQATDDVSPAGQLVYLVYRATTSGGESFAAPSYTTAAGAVGLTVTGLAPSTKYYFVVRARDQAGNIDQNRVEVGQATSSVSFSGDVVPILLANCASGSCHAGGTPAQGLNLSSASSAYADLVGVPSKECATTARVAPGSPSTSYLLWKLQGAGPCFAGSQMPRGSPPLSATDLSTISAWIVAGAPNN